MLFYTGSDYIMKQKQKQKKTMENKKPSYLSIAKPAAW